MSREKEEDKRLLSHHEQQALCGSRAPYRQGRRLTAVKAYSVNNESAHLLIFGVPSLNLRRETKDLFIKFGRLIKFNIMKDYAVEEFTETYHAHYDRIQSARIAKKMLDTKNFYGGSLHVCYAPELETVEETRSKLVQRKRDVSFRLRNLQRDEVSNQSHEQGPNSKANVQLNDVTETNNISLSAPIGPKWDKHEFIDCYQSESIPVSENNEIVNEVRLEETNVSSESAKLNMGDHNIIYVHTNNRKRKKKSDSTEKTNSRSKNVKKDYKAIESSTDIVDCTSTEREVISNINEALNYNQFGNELVRKVETKPLNKIVFNVNKKT